MRALFVGLRRVLAPLVAIGAGFTVVGAGGCGPSSTSASSDACGGYFDAILGTSCDPTRPSSERARERGRFLTVCEAELALPGEGALAGQIEACTKALTSTGTCLLSNENGGPATPNECQGLNSGTLGAGAGCSSSSQCQSGNCNITSVSATCGSCTVPIAIGQACGLSAGSFDCGMGSVCAQTSMTCELPVYGSAGATCGTEGALCADGFYCDPTTDLCARTKPAGSSCAMNQGECASSLVCLGTTNQCGSPGQSGASCTSGGDCAPGFDCGTADQCVAISYAAAGQPCGGPVHCLVGSCTGNGSGDVCPTIISDGQSCPQGQPIVSVSELDASPSPLTAAEADASPLMGPAAAPTTCDLFADCVNGVCTLLPATCH